MHEWMTDKNTLSVISGWFTNLSAGWFGSILILLIISSTDKLLLLTVNLPSAIVSLWLAIILAKKGNNEQR